MMNIHVLNSNKPQKERIKFLKKKIHKTVCDFYVNKNPLEVLSMTLNPC